MKLTKNSACPVCGEQLYISRLSCPSCRAEFPVEESISDFDRLDAAQSEFLYTFLACRGSLKVCRENSGPHTRQQRNAWRNC